VFTPPDVPGYALRELIGQGGFAAVYLATQIAVGRDVAVKIDNRLVSGERDQRRFFREVNSAGRLSDHPHVVGLYDAGTLPDGRPYLVMELCPGGSLANLIQQRGHLPPAEVRDIGLRVADALGAAHQLGVLHRDIKPGNILINRYGLVGLADFGLASILSPDSEQSATREALTPAYAAPEAFALAEPAAPADVYSLGATLYALLAGRPPRFPDVGSPSFATILRMHDEPVPVLPWVPAPLMNVILCALASNPAARYPDGNALRDALAQLPAEDTSTGRDEHPSLPTFPSIPTAPSFRTAPVVPATSAFAGAQSFPDAPFQPAARVPSGGGTGGLSTLVRAGAAALLVAAVSIGTLVALDPFGEAATDAKGGAGQSSTRVAADPAPRPDGKNGKTVKGVEFGVTTTTEDCPAVGSDGTGGRCTTDAECWSSMVVIVGKVEITRLPCDGRHTFETFAIAPLPKDALTSNQRTLAAHPTVRQLCNKKVMRQSRLGAARSIPMSKWMVEVLPPSERAYDEGARVYRCVAAILGNLDGTRGSVFTSKS
jgi:hypothetical protein